MEIPLLFIRLTLRIPNPILVNRLTVETQGDQYNY